MTDVPAHGRFGKAKGRAPDKLNAMLGDLDLHRALHRVDTRHTRARIDVEIGELNNPASQLVLYSGARQLFESGYI